MASSYTISPSVKSKLEAVVGAFPNHSDPNFIDRFGRIRVPRSGQIVSLRHSIYGICMRNGALLVTLPTWAEQWELPGGGVDEGESASFALNREFLEETGYVIVGAPKPFHSVLVNYYSDDLDQYFHASMDFWVVQVDPVRRSEPVATEVKAVKWLTDSSLANTTHVIHAAIIQGFLHAERT